MTRTRLLLIDGHSTAFRAFYAMRSPENFLTSTGQYTNAVFVFCRMLTRLLKDYTPDEVAVAFDTKAPTFRKERYPEYKEGRKETPVEFRGQIELIQTALEALGITTISQDGIEADDILATLAHRGAQRNYEVYVASGDRDMYQVITDRVSVLYPGSSTQNLQCKTPEDIEQEFGVTPQRYPELAALVGESADNLSGVPGIGKKLAAKLLAQFDGLDNLLERVDEIPGKRGEAVRAHVEDVRRNRSLNALLVDADLPVDVGDLTVGAGDRAAWDRLCEQLEFSSVRGETWREVARVRPAGVGEEAPQRALVRVDVAELGCSLEEWVSAEEGTIGVDVVGDMEPAEAQARLITFARGEEAVTVGLGGDDDVRVLGDVLHTYAPRLAYADFKGAWHALRAMGVDAACPGVDVTLAAYLLKPDARSFAVEDLAREFLEREAPSTEDALTLFGDDEGPSAWRAQAIADLVAVLDERLREARQVELLRTLELPLAPILARMEDTGIAVDVPRLDELKADLTHQVERARELALAEVDRPDLNLSSPKQLQEVLFEQLQMPPTRKTKRGYTTNAEALTQLYAQTRHPFLAYLLDHRDKIRLLQTVEGLAKQVGDDGRIHTVFQQTVTATGRLSSVNPNLQNIPGRTPTGRAIREAFVAGEGFEGLMTADYSQIEMRVMAAMSGDRALLGAFEEGEDLHRTMAAMVFGIDAEAVTADQRSKIKATSYGLAYGLSAFGLSRQLDISQSEAAELRERYFRRFQGIRDYLDGLVEEARHRGYTETVFGRRRYVPELNAASRPERAMAERAALNAPIQGSAADIIKRAMVDVDAALSAAGLHSRLLLQVHDELILEVASGEREVVCDLVRDKMRHAVDLGVELEVSVGYGRTWREAAH